MYIHAMICRSIILWFSLSKQHTIGKNIYVDLKALKYMELYMYKY